MSKLSKALLESFDSLDSFVREASPKPSKDKKQSLNEDAKDIAKAIEETKPKDGKYLTFDYEVNQDGDEVSLICYGTEAIDSIDEDSDIDLDDRAISKVEAWAKKLAKRIPALRDSVECEVESDWYSGMSVYGEHGPYTYDCFTMFLYVEDEELDEEFIPNHNGEHCPKCGSNNYVEVDDEEYEDGTQIYHYECQECGYVSPTDEYNPEDDELYEDVNIESNKDACYTYTASSTNEHMVEQFNDAFNRIKARLDQYDPSIKDLSDKTSRFISHACRFEIAADENHIVTVSLNRSLPDGIYNNDYIIVSSRLKTMHNEDVNIGGLNATHVSSTEDIGESYTYGIWKGDSIEDHKVSGNLDAHLDEVEKVINEYRKDS